MPRTKRDSDGMAMIMVLVMIIIFASLILAVVISSSTAIRRAHYYKDKSTALQVAEAGLQDALYWMNYKGYDSGNCYPCTNLTTGTYDYNLYLKYFRGSDYPPLSDPTATDTWTATEPTPGNDYLGYNPTGIQGARCVVEFSDEDETDTANLDTIKSTGHYKGRTATVSVRIRGQNGEGNPEHIGRALNNFYYDGSWPWPPRFATWGIPEAFNKHVIYARKVSGTANKIVGNIFAGNTIDLVSTTANLYTVTIAKPSYFDNFTIADTEIYREDIPDISPPPPPPPPYEVYFLKAEGVYSDLVFGFKNDATGYDTCINWDYTTGLPEYLDTSLPSSSPLGIGYNGNDYTFGDTQIDYSFFVKGNGTAGATFNNANLAITKTFEVTGTLTMTSDNITVSYPVKVGGSLTISDAITTDTEPVFIVGGSVTLNNNVTGDFVVVGNPTTTSISIGSGVTIAGALIADKINTFTSTNSSIDATNSKYKAGLYVNATGNISFTLPSTSTFEIGDNQDAGIVLYSEGGDITAEIQKDLVETDGFVSGKSAIVSYSNANISTCPITINNNVDINGLIYSHNDNTSNTNAVEVVYINNTIGSLKGAIVTNGKVTFNNAVTLEYDSDLYKDPANYQIYPNFKGGRRRYLPVPGSLEIEW
jgi:Tfp pilus assembly protein PilX